MTDPEAVPAEAPRVRDDVPARRRPNAVYQALAWVGIVVGVLFIVAMIFVSGVVAGTAAGVGGWHHGYRSGPGWSDGDSDGCPMMRSDDVPSGSSPMPMPGRR